MPAADLGREVLTQLPSTVADFQPISGPTRTVPSIYQHGSHNFSTSQLLSSQTAAPSPAAHHLFMPDSLNAVNTVPQQHTGSSHINQNISGFSDNQWQALVAAFGQPISPTSRMHGPSNEEADWTG
ncbi:unnamed protein product [Cuscuta epithymum]|uniref:Uncharacterized protein n=1 Tax=Cuscuta epithymum TaxID=186058 RepID=A0AAV0EU85_9ASTE|nr:unnamed protein product [Cuscuta epithymum]